MAADYQPRIRIPTYLARGRATVSELPVYVDSTLTAPDSGTYTLTRPDGTAAVDAQAVTVASSVATYSVTPASTETLGEGWLETWALVWSGTTRVFTREAAVVRNAPMMTVTSADLRARHPELAVQASTVADDELACEEAWLEMQRWLISRGRRPYLVIPSGSLHEPTLYLALSIRARTLATFASGSRWSEMATEYREMYERARDGLVLTYDYDADGMPDTGEQLTSARGVLFLSQPPMRWRGVVDG